MSAKADSGVKSGASRSDAQTFVCESRRAGHPAGQGAPRRVCRRRREIDESIISGRKAGAAMGLLYNVSAPTVSRIVAAWLSVQF